jgi:hypothetical protein
MHCGVPAHGTTDANNLHTIGDGEVWFIPVVVGLQPQPWALNQGVVLSLISLFLSLFPRDARSEGFVCPKASLFSLGLCLTCNLRWPWLLGSSLLSLLPNPGRTRGSMCGLSQHCAGTQHESWVQVWLHDEFPRLWLAVFILTRDCLLRSCCSQLGKARCEVCCGWLGSSTLADLGWSEFDRLSGVVPYLVLLVFSGALLWLVLHTGCC